MASDLAKSKEWLRWLPYSIRMDEKCEFNLIEKKYAITMTGSVGRMYHCPNKEEHEKFQKILAKYSEDDEQIFDTYGPVDMTVFVAYRFVKK